MMLPKQAAPSQRNRCVRATESDEPPGDEYKSEVMVYDEKLVAASVPAVLQVSQPPSKESVRRSSRERLEGLTFQNNARRG